MARPEYLLRRFAEDLRLAVEAGRNVRVPEPLLLVWGWFGDLSLTRTYNQTGPNAISYAEIEAYARLKRLPIDDRHVDMIRAMDDAFLRGTYKKTTTTSTTTKVPYRAAKKITPKAFDAVF